MVNQGYSKEGANPKGEHQSIVRPNFPGNSMKMKKIKSGIDGCARRKFVYVDLPLISYDMM